MSKIRIVVAGAAGRMGRSLIAAIAASGDLELSGALARRGHFDLGRDAGTLAGVGELGVALTDDPLPLVAKAHAILDFTSPPYSVALAGLAAQARITHVIGTTGFAPPDESQIRAASRHAVIVKSANMSLGVTLLASLVEKAAAALPDFDVEIVEMHHRNKVDSPSGTALLLGRAAADGRKVSLEENWIRRRDGNDGKRAEGKIGFASLRGGTVVGEHQVILAGNSERVVLSHIAEDRSIFATGALQAARWGQGRKPGLYSIADVLGLG